MCGIAGCLNLDPNEPADPAVIHAMTDAMVHRGPDGEGHYVDGPMALGHRRLAIIDVAGGAQPICNEAGTLWLIHNGEIYNHKELRRELLNRHTFRTQSDSEVILHLYEEVGPQCVDSLNGMFAFAIWDERKRTLFLARDRLGIKPLYWMKHGGRFAFASEIKGFFAAGLIDAITNYEALPEFLTFQFLLGDSTLFDGVHRLEPGTTLRIKAEEDARPRISRYWDISCEVDDSLDYDECVSRVELLLNDSIALRLRSDVSVGAYLSGGLDSSIVTALAAKHSSQALSVFSGAFDGKDYDETQYAKMVASATGAAYFEIRPNEDDFISDLPELIYMMDEPAAGPGLFPQYHVSRLAAENVKVCLGGQGGDELFGGYARYLAAYLEQCLKGAIHGTQGKGEFVVTWDEIAPNLPMLAGYTRMLQGFWSSGLFADMDQRYLRLIDRSEGSVAMFSQDIWNSDSRSNVEARFREHFNQNGARSYFAKMTSFDLKWLLPALLQVEDRVSMAASLESRVPLLDHRIVDLVTRMPPRMRFRGGSSKRILRDVANGIVPDAVIQRTDKMGFPIPLNDWLQREPVRSFVYDALLGSGAAQRGLWDMRKLEQQLARGGFSRGVWGLLCIELWHQAFTDRQFIRPTVQRAYHLRRPPEYRAQAS